MSTIYKIEMTIVSDWVSYSDEDVIKIIDKLMKQSSLRIREIKTKEE